MHIPKNNSKYDDNLTLLTLNSRPEKQNATLMQVLLMMLHGNESRLVPSLVFYLRHIQRL